MMDKLCGALHSVFEGNEELETHLSTVGVELKRTDAESWVEIEDLDSGFERQAYRVAALRMAAQEHAASKRRQSLPRRVSRGLANAVRRRSSAEQPFVAEVQVELVPEAEVARRFDIAEIGNMAGKTQSGEKIFFTIWDYAGQEVFYALHHIFLTREGGIFMLVFDMQELLIKQDEALEYLAFWLNSVKLHAPKAPVLLVGTHYDQASKRGSLQTVEKTLRNDLKAMRGVKLVKNQAQRLSFFPINNMSSAVNRAIELRRAVEKSASKLESVSQKISLRWLKVIDDLMKLDSDHVPFAAVQELADQYHAGDQTDELLKFFHELGMLVHLRATGTLHDKVVLNPQWLLDKLARVIADEIHVQEIYFDERLADLELEDDFALLREKGICSRSLLEYLWNDEEVDYLREFMHDNMLLSDWNFPESSLPKHRQNETLYLVSSLLKNSTDASLDAEIAEMESGLTCVLDFSEFFLPDGVFARMLSLCAQYSGDVNKGKRAPQLAGDRAIIRFGFSVFALVEDGDKIWVRMAQDAHKPAATLKTLVSIFRGARDAVFRDLPWKLLLQSPTDDSVLVTYDDVVEARGSGERLVMSVGTKNTRAAEFAPFFEDGSLTEDEEDASSVEKEDIPLSGFKYHVFISHRQVDAGDACNLMAEKLRNRGLRVWIDQETEGNLAEDAMRRGIRESKCYLLFLSKTVFSSAVKMELETALQEEKPVLLVHEGDPTRTGFANFSKYIDDAPASAKHLFSEMESMPFQRRLYLAKGFYEELIMRIKNATAGRDPLSLQEVLASSVLHLLGQYQEPFEGTFAELADLLEGACQQLGVGQEYAPVWTRSCLNVFLALGLLETLPDTPLHRAKDGAMAGERGITSLQRVIVAADGQASNAPLGLVIRRSQDDALSNIDDLLARVLELQARKESLLAKEAQALQEIFPRALEDFQPEIAASNPSASSQPDREATPTKDLGQKTSTTPALLKSTTGEIKTVDSAAQHARRTRFFLPSSTSLMPESLERELEANASVSSRNANASNAALGLAMNPSSSVQYSAGLCDANSEIAARVRRAREHVNRVREVLFQNGPRAFDELCAARNRYLNQHPTSKVGAEPERGRARSTSLDETLDAVRVIGPRDGPKIRAPKFMAPVAEFVGPNMSVRLQEEVSTEPFDFADIVVQFRVSGTEETRHYASPLARVTDNSSALDPRASPTGPVPTDDSVRNFEDAAKKTAQGTDVDLPSWRVHDWRKDPATPGPGAPKDDPRDEIYSARHAIAREAATLMQYGVWRPCLRGVTDAQAGTDGDDVHGGDDTSANLEGVTSMVEIPTEVKYGAIDSLTQALLTFGLLGDEIIRKRDRQATTIAAYASKHGRRR
ncbi:Ras-related protein Rab-8A [Hondaea fermentalgiana]|uniref:Ras-related protein Rab-8A n=1 Tax=Hondaea fermentalgiana TaxID=2315210 RepID=A0A2R5G9A0_9STRA|nr:Ras-related protein Rab-8A [Hondaea fermentalgiana]|eukprot:GBG26358.1 Ras-related protein Rab-8A [Hondaea fermentalgiana]